MDRYLVVGNPIAHSKSPDIHRMFANQCGQALSYEKQLIPIDAFAVDVAEFFSAGGKGMNVTVPFKEEAYRFANSLSERAELAGAVNTLTLQADGTVQGDTTDGAGLVADIQRLSWPLADARVLVLGAGGAVRGTLQPILRAGVASVTVANRTRSKAEALADVFSPYGTILASSFDGLTDQRFDLIINGTSASLSNDLPPIPESLVTDTVYIYDMMYAAGDTAFNQWARALGAQHLADGLGMLVGQAAESFYIWRGVRPDPEPVITELRKVLSA